MTNGDKRRKRHETALKAAAKRRATYSEGELRQISEKAQETLLREWGRGERRRMAPHAAYTKKHGKEDKKNPYSRENY
jgi:hypothetical protein